MNLALKSNPSLEQAFVAKATDGDLEAFNQLVSKYQDVVFQHAYALLDDQDLAEDAAQEAFIKAFQNIASFRGGSLRAWLLTIVTNIAYDFMRRSKRHPIQPLFPEGDDGEEVESPAWLADPNASVQETVETNELTKDIYRALDTLPNIYRSVLTLIDLYELDYTEAAQALQVPIGTVKSRLARARLQLKKQLQGKVEYQECFCLADASITV
jgi:RNA polymerase sigma-70 factor (ECF subfamily)